MKVLSIPSGHDYQISQGKVIPEGHMYAGNYAVDRDTFLKYLTLRYGTEQANRIIDIQWNSLPEYAAGGGGNKKKRKSRRRKSKKKKSKTRRRRRRSGTRRRRR